MGEEVGENGNIRKKSIPRYDVDIWEMNLHFIKMKMIKKIKHKN